MSKQKTMQEYEDKLSELKKRVDTDDYITFTKELNDLRKSYSEAVKNEVLRKCDALQAKALKRKIKIDKQRKELKQ